MKKEEEKIALPSEERQTISTIVGIEINLPLEDSFFTLEKGGQVK